MSDFNREKIPINTNKIVGTSGVANRQYCNHKNATFKIMIPKNANS